jgi:hypothetical protein
VSVTAGLTPDDAFEADLTEPHSPEGRLAEARLRTNVTFVPWPPATREA